MDFRNCADCQKIITFEEFCRDHPLMSKPTAKMFWNNKIFSIYCPNCFYNRPECPYKNLRGRHRSYYEKIAKFR